jgi:hypothetical protein
MLAVLQFLAVLCCLLFAGAALYINLVEHAARMDCDTVAPFFAYPATRYAYRASH